VQINIVTQVPNALAYQVLDSFSGQNVSIRTMDLGPWVWERRTRGTYRRHKASTIHCNKGILTFNK